MKPDRISDVLIGAAGDVAGTVVDPRMGLARLRSVANGRAAVIVAVGVIAGFLLARYRRRS